MVYSIIDDICVSCVRLGIFFFIHSKILLTLREIVLLYFEGMCLI